MPPRSGQLDQISEAIGELKGQLGSVEKYVHEGRHGVNNLAQKVDAMRVGIGKDMASVEARIEAKFEAFAKITDERLRVLEAAHVKADTQKNAVIWFLQSPLVGWIAAAALAFFAWWRKHP